MTDIARVTQQYAIEAHTNAGGNAFVTQQAWLEARVPELPAIHVDQQYWIVAYHNVRKAAPFPQVIG